MKTLKIFGTAFIMIFASFLTQEAQAQETADVNVSANVLAALTLNTTDIDFGNVQNNTASTVAPTAAGTDINAGVAGSTIIRGLVDITGVANGTLDVTCTDATLDDGTGNTISFSTNAEVGGTALNCGADTITLDGSGNATVNIGGSLTAASTAGAYSTSTGGSPITFSFTYQ